MSASRVQDGMTMACLWAGFLLILFGQWGQPYWLEYLNRKRGGLR